MVNPYNNLTDEEIMELYQKDNHLAFDALYHRYKEKVYTYLRKRLNDDNLIDEVFQQIFFKLHKSKDSYSSKYIFPKWIYTISRTVLLDNLKKKKLKTIELQDSHEFQEQEKEIEIFDIHSESSLSSDEKVAMEMRFYQDSDYIDISKALETSQSNARKLISRGIKKLKSKYSGGLND